MKTIGRILTAMVTPFDSEGRIDYTQVKQLAQALVASGSQGLVVTGTTGEAPTLFDDEKLRMYGAVTEAVSEQAAVIACTATNSTADTILLTRQADKLGLDGFLLTVPYYNNPPQEGLYQHFKAIAEATDKPCILYNVPSRTVRNLEAATTIRLSQIENIVGIKEASGNLDQISKIIESAHPGFLVWSGNDNDTLPILAVGGYGVVSVVTHLVGLQVKELFDKFLARDIAGAAALHRRLLPLVNALFVMANPIPVKFMLNQIGFNVGKPRLPLVEPDDKTAAQIKEILAQYHIDLPIPAYR